MGEQGLRAGTKGKQVLEGNVCTVQPGRTEGVEDRGSCPCSGEAAEGTRPEAPARVCCNLRAPEALKLLTEEVVASIPASCRNPLKLLADLCVLACVIFWEEGVESL